MCVCVCVLVIIPQCFKHSVCRFLMQLLLTGQQCFSTLMKHFGHNARTVSLCRLWSVHHHIFIVIIFIIIIIITYQWLV